MSQFGSEPFHDPTDLGFDKARLARPKRWMQRFSDTRPWPGGAVLIARQTSLFNGGGTIGRARCIVALVRPAGGGLGARCWSTRGLR